MMIDSRSLIYLWLIFLVFNLLSFAQEESSMIKKLSKGADVILIGKVTEKKSSWNENKTRIYTKTTVQVEEYLKGSSNGNDVNIIYLGGEVGDVGELYTHMPKFEDNEEVLVFLKKDGKNEGYKVFSGEDGKMTVISDGKTKEKVTSSNLRIKDLKSQIKSFINEQ